MSEKVKDPCDEIGATTGGDAARTDDASDVQTSDRGAARPFRQPLSFHVTQSDKIVCAQLGWWATDHTDDPLRGMYQNRVAKLVEMRLDRSALLDAGGERIPVDYVGDELLTELATDYFRKMNLHVNVPMPTKTAGEMAAASTGEQIGARQPPPFK